jgi:hypothetical protein
MSKSCRASMLGETHPKGREDGEYAVLVGAKEERAVTVKEWKARRKLLMFAEKPNLVLMSCPIGQGVDG